MSNNSDSSKIKLPQQTKNTSNFRPTIFPYNTCLPYKQESNYDASIHLNHIINELYITVKSFEEEEEITFLGFVRLDGLTSDLNRWIDLNHDISSDSCVKLINLYYDLLPDLFFTNSLDMIDGAFTNLCGSNGFFNNYNPPDFHITIKPLVKIFKNILSNFKPSTFEFEMNLEFSSLWSIAESLQPFFQYYETQYIFEELLPLVCHLLNFFSIDFSCFCKPINIFILF